MIRRTHTNVGSDTTLPQFTLHESGFVTIIAYGTWAGGHITLAVPAANAEIETMTITANGRHRFFLPKGIAFNLKTSVAVGMDLTIIQTVDDGNDGL